MRALLFREAKLFDDGLQDFGVNGREVGLVVDLEQEHVARLLGGDDGIGYHSRSARFSAPFRGDRHTDLAYIRAQLVALKGIAAERGDKFENILFQRAVALGQRLE